VRHDEHVLNGIVDPEVCQTEPPQKRFDVLSVRSEQLRRLDGPVGTFHTP
jgi:hypothetical protein